jgi:hypothetical protein
VDTRDSRWLTWTGPLFVLVFYVGALGLGGSMPGEKASADKVVAYFESHQGRSLIGVFLAPAMCTLLLLFFAYVRSLARTGGADGGGVGPTVMIAGAILWASGILVGASVTLMTASAAHHGQDAVALTANVLGNDIWLPFIGGIAVTLIGAGLTVLHTGVLPRWMGWAAVVVGVVSLAGPGGFLGFFVAPVWMLVAGVLLARRAPVAAAAV